MAKIFISIILIAIILTAFSIPAFASFDIRTEEDQCCIGQGIIKCLHDEVFCSHTQTVWIITVSHHNSLCKSCAAAIPGTHGTHRWSIIQSGNIQIRQCTVCGWTTSI